MTPRQSAGWRVEHHTGSAASLLDPWPRSGPDDRRVVRAGRMSGRAALVLGSTQNRAQIDEHHAAREGIDIIRRSTGGGAVLVAPHAQVWLDFWVPRTDELWDDDIITAAGWLGDVWVAALHGLGSGPLHVHRGPSTRDVLSDLVCFAGIGPGEVHVGPADQRGPKVVGLAQRRTRRGARFHTTAPLEWPPDDVLDLLDLGERVEGHRPLQDAAVGLRALTVAPSGLSDVDLIGVVENAVTSALP